MLSSPPTFSKFAKSCRTGFFSSNPTLIVAKVKLSSHGHNLDSQILTSLVACNLAASIPIVLQGHLNQKTPYHILLVVVWMSGASSCWW